jgi:hypothetical protein
MKKILLVFFTFFFGLAVPSHAFVDTLIKTVSGNVTAAYDAAYQAFMKVQVVEQTQTMLKNYNESKVFYDRMKEITNAKGGIAGYAKDNIKNTIDRQNDDVYWRINRDFIKANGSDSFVGQAVRNTDKGIQSRLDYSQEIHNLNLSRDKVIKTEIVEKAGDKNLKQEDREKIALLAAITQLEVTNEMNKTIQQLLIIENERSAKDWANERQASIEIAKMKDVLSKMSKDRKAAVTDPYKILQELPQ